MTSQPVPAPGYDPAATHLDSALDEIDEALVRFFSARLPREEDRQRLNRRERRERIPGLLPRAERCPGIGGD